MSLNGSQRAQLSEAIMAAFTINALRRMLTYQLDRDLDNYVSGGPFPDVVYELIEAAEREGWTPQLIVAARQANPGNRKLQMTADALGVSAAPVLIQPNDTPASVQYPDFERAVTANSFLDVAQWRMRQAQMEDRICQISLKTNKGMMFGTGFLIGPDVIITNHHVMAPAIEGERSRSASDGKRATAADVALRFDYRRLADGVSVNNGTFYRLTASNWLICCSPPSEVDAIPEPKPELPRANELDFALLRVAESPGASKLGPDGPTRGWIQIPAVPYDFASSQALFIMQHPKETPLQLVLDTDANIKVNANGTRVTYRTNTLDGSSGSPCFSMNWDLIALHHMGDPDWNPDHKPVYNQGIPISAIRRLLEEQSLTGVLDGG